MSLIRWNPLYELEDFFDRYHKAAATKGGKENMIAADWTPSVDIIENNEEFLIKAEIPEIEKDNIKVNVAEGILSISGERKFEKKEEKGEKVHRIERYYGSFARSFTLPENVDGDNISAEHKNGVLTLHLKKIEKPEPKSIDIKIS